MDFAHVFQVNGGHLGCTSHPDAGEYPQYSLTVLMDTDNVGVAVGFPLPATVQYLFFDLLYVFPVLHPPFRFTVEHMVGIHPGVTW